MKVLVTGATGFIGEKLVEQLVGKQIEVVVLTRNIEKAKRRLGFPVNFFKWELGEVLPSAALKGVHSIVHLAGESVAEGRWTQTKRKRIFESRVVGTQKIVEATNQFGSDVESFISASAIGFYGERGETWLNEASSKGDGFLADVCEAWEEEAQKCANGSRRAISLRIGMVLGREGALSKLLPVFRTGFGGPVGSGAQWISWIHVDDLVALILHALECKALQGVVNAVAPHPVTNKVFSKTLGKVLARPAFLPVPKSALRIALGQMSELATKSQRIKPEKALASGFRFQFPDIESALKEICPDPKLGNEERFTKRQWIKRPLDEVFAFFSEAKNLEKITPPWLNFSILEPYTSPIEAGQFIDYQLKIRGIPCRWQSKILQYEPNQSFVDYQTKGPYKKWHHTHSFTSLQDGTLIQDEVRYEVPGGGIGNLLLGAWIRSDLEKIFAYRQETIEKLFAG